MTADGGALLNSGIKREERGESIDFKEKGWFFRERKLNDKMSCLIKNLGYLYCLWNEVVLGIFLSLVTNWVKKYTSAAYVNKKISRH